MMPALLLHLASAGPKIRVRTAFYGASAAMPNRARNETMRGLVSIPFGEVAKRFCWRPQGVLRLVILSGSGAPSRETWYQQATRAYSGNHRHRYDSPLPINRSGAADYLLLGFFCVTLYYQEELIFFDLLIKRGMFFCVCLTALVAFFVLRRSSGAVSEALLLTLYGCSRRGSTGVWDASSIAFFCEAATLEAGAERMFTTELQASSGEEDFAFSRQIFCLSAIFQTSAEVMFTSGPLTQEKIRTPWFADLEQQGWAAIEQTDAEPTRWEFHL